ncbi:hypothetical protein LJY25_04830 [Hymenobacter sp. BT175]|uniref:hypothetical protein n=1 Tax=Hymenobacter translucens TaxID=2886507 RepID=UPI001D0EC3CF|nr:hypothetical protein [Hymenobacter translucens]MCC2545761.1 hypothetical protein [Hymenobacter translucens]
MTKFFDKSLLRTVLFAVALVTLVIGVYQTVLLNDLPGNYWLFMISFGCVLGFKYLGREKEEVATKATPVAGRKPAPKPGPGKGPKKAR